MEGIPRYKVIAVTALPDASIRRQLSDVLTRAGWTVHAATDRDDAMRLCRKAEADVLLLADAFPGGAITLLDRLKRDPDLFRTSVVFVGDGLDVGGVGTAMQHGAADVLRTPLDPADVVARATAAARTKALVKELTAQNDRLEGLVFYDELTGLRNRRAILHDLDMLLATARRHDRALAALMIDVDGFKLINDHHGHGAGDDVLRELAVRISERLREGDIAGRLGGDELLVILPETDAEGAARLADSVRAAAGAGPVETTSEGRVNVTVSIGSAAWTGDNAAMLLERADRALYVAKAAGRDRAVSDATS